ncbi:MAG TPA: hypothetical protein VEK13_02850 [Thermoplasmata archaeon]|nr:hypothetical protein [Thermoplasmata archaeon]
MNRATDPATKRPKVRTVNVRPPHSGSTHRHLRSVGLTGVVLCVLLGLAANAAAGTTGYDRSYSQSPSTSNPDVSLIRLTTSYSSGLNLTCAFTVAGTVVLSDSDFGYIVLFGGNTTSNSNAYASFGGNTSRGTLTAVNISWFGSGSGVSPLSFDLSNVSSTLSFSVAIKLVGPASNFSVMAEALYVNASGEQSSTLGGASHSSSATLSSPVLGVVVTAVVGAAIVLGVVGILWRRRRKPSAATDFV